MSKCFGSDEYWENEGSTTECSQILVSGKKYYLLLQDSQQFFNGATDKGALSFSKSPGNILISAQPQGGNVPDGTPINISNDSFSIVVWQFQSGNEPWKKVGTMGLTTISRDKNHHDMQVVAVSDSVVDTDWKFVKDGDSYLRIGDSFELNNTAFVGAMCGTHLGYIDCAHSDTPGKMILMDMTNTVEGGQIDFKKCKDDSTCDENYSCQDGVCVLKCGDGGTCGRPEYCVNGHCMPSTGCRISSDCFNDQSCQNNHCASASKPTPPGPGPSPNPSTPGGNMRLVLIIAGSVIGLGLILLLLYRMLSK